MQRFITLVRGTHSLVLLSSFDSQPRRSGFDSQCLEIIVLPALWFHVSNGDMSEYIVKKPPFSIIVLQCWLLRLKSTVVFHLPVIEWICSLSIHRSLVFLPRLHEVWVQLQVEEGHFYSESQLLSQLLTSLRESPCLPEKPFVKNTKIWYTIIYILIIICWVHLLVFLCWTRNVNVMLSDTEFWSILRLLNECFLAIYFFQIIYSFVYIYIHTHIYPAVTCVLRKIVFTFPGKR